MSTLQLSTSSRRRTFRECPRKHKLAYLDGWKTVRVSDALHVGTAFHLGLEHWWQDAPHAAAALEHVEGKGRDPFEQARIDAMLVGYHYRWIGDRKRYRVIGVEIPFEGPLLNPDTGETAINWRFAGKVDGLAVENVTNETIVVEHKTTSDAIEGDDADYWQKLSMDDQCSAYTVGATFLGHEPRYVLYDVARKPALKPLKATPPEKRKRKKNGDWYAWVRLEDETPAAYFKRLVDELLDKPERYYQRKLIPRDDYQLREFMRDTWALTKQMDAAFLDDLHPRNPDACHRFGRCGFYDICSLGLDPAEHPDRWERKTSQNEELETDDDGHDDDWFAEFDPGREAAHA